MIAGSKASRKSYAMLSQSCRAEGSSLVQEFNRIASAHSALNQNRGVNTSLAVMRLGDLSAELRIRFSGIGIERDHLAARIALENRDDGFRSETHRSAYERILAKARC